VLVKLGLVIAALVLLYVFYPTYELVTRSGSPAWAADDRTYWSLADCRAAGRALAEAEWRCRANNPWHLLFRTGTRYDPDINASQRELEGG
jgi:hypothetical protein